MRTEDQAAETLTNGLTPAPEKPKRAVKKKPAAKKAAKKKAAKKKPAKRRK